MHRHLLFLPVHIDDVHDQQAKIYYTGFISLYRKNGMLRERGTAMRLFLGYLPDKETKEKLRRVQEEIRAKGIQGNYYDPERLHMTLVFIGDYDDTDRVMNLVRKIPCAEMVLDPDCIDIIRDRYVLKYRDNAALGDYVKRIRACLQANGIPYADDVFKAHFTLVDAEQKTLKTQIDLSFAAAKVSSVSLLQSNKETGGKGYTLIGTHYFGSHAD